MDHHSWTQDQWQLFNKLLDDLGWQGNQLRDFLSRGMEVTRPADTEKFVQQLRTTIMKLEDALPTDERFSVEVNKGEFVDCDDWKLRDRFAALSVALTYYERLKKEGHEVRVVRFRKGEKPVEIRNSCES